MDSYTLAQPTQQRHRPNESITASSQATRDFHLAVIGWRQALDDYELGIIGFPELVEACRELAEASRQRRRGFGK
jgi:hypothetical protein